MTIISVVAAPIACREKNIIDQKIEHKLNNKELNGFFPCSRFRLFPD